MRWNTYLQDKVKSKNFLGLGKANGRVTVDPFWTLKETTSIYGNSFRGPYRYYTDNEQVEYEIPSVKSISWDRSNSQDLGSCTVTIYNTWHQLNTEEQQLDGQLGLPGYFWPKRGQGDSSVTWEQEPGKGAYKKDGTWDPNFSWANVLVEDALIRTYEGYGGAPVDGNYTSVDENLEDGNIVITGVWIVDSVTADAAGSMTLQCTDIGRILLDQIVFPPVIPPAVYPLEYYPPGRSSFDSAWGPRIAAGKTLNQYGQNIELPPVSKGEIWIRSATSSGDSDSTVDDTASPAVNQHPSEHAIDGNWDTYAMSEAYETTDGGRPYFEFTPGPSVNYAAAIDSMQLKAWAGGYTVYVSIQEDTDPENPGGGTAWRGNENVPGTSMPYIKKVNIPLALPDGYEEPFNVSFKDVEVDDDPYQRADMPELPTPYYARKVRLTFENLYYSHIPNGSGHRYRCGIRDFIVYRNGDQVSDYSPELDNLPWTFAIDQHPTRGYWIVDNYGNVYGFGDAADYDSTGFGQIPIATYGNAYQGKPTNRAVGIAAHPSGEGYWVVDWMGRVWAYGAALEATPAVVESSPGVVIPNRSGEYQVPNPWVAFGKPTKVQARGIAATHTGEGYWVVYSNGTIRGFGDASPSYAVVPSTDVSNFMEWFLPQHYDVGKYIPYNIGLKATAIASHPTKMGFWVTDGSGQVFAFNGAGESTIKHHGQLKNRVYGSGNASGGFKLQNLEWATSIESTKSGEGYWIAFGSGRVASFGDATKLGKNPYVFEQVREVYEENILVDEFSIGSTFFFRDILWSIARDPDGDGFWVLRANGEVFNYEADFWGKPGHNGVGYRWLDGNFNGDWMEIVKEVLMWGGFLFYDPSDPITETEEPSAYALLESTGIFTDTDVPPDKFDKKTLLDVIKELTEVVGYRFRITEDGRAQYASPNWWRAGNFDEDGSPIYIDDDGVRVESDDPEAQPFIPTVHELEDLLTYSVTLSSTDKRSELIIGTDLPDAKDPTRTGYVRHTPPHALETVSGGVSTMRGINRVGMWVSQLFENEEERKLMAELIGLHSWFASRVGSASIVGNPALSIDDQVRLVERTTSETFIHLVTSINSSLDNDTGVYTMDIGTNWLGSADDWVIAKQPKDSEYIYTVISERLNSWQLKTDRGLDQSGDGSVDQNIFYATGEFDRAVQTTGTIDHMIVLGDSMSYLDSTLNGLTGDRWPNLLENADIVGTVDNGAYSGFTTADLVNPGTRLVEPDSSDALVIFVGANDQNVSLSGVTVEQFSENLLWLLDNYPATQQLVVFPWEWTGYPEAEPDPAPTQAEYNAFAEAAQSAAALRGAKFLNMGDVVEELAEASDTVGWDEYIVDWIHPSALGHELIASYVSDRLHLSYGDSGGWDFEGTLTTIHEIDNVYINADIVSNLGINKKVEFYNHQDVLVGFFDLDQGNRFFLGTLGAPNETRTYTVRAYGVPVTRGQAKLRLSFTGTNSVSPYMEDSILFLDLVEPGEEVDIPTTPTTPVSSGDVLFGWSATGVSDYNVKTGTGGYSVPAIWRQFETTSFSNTNVITTALNDGVFLNVSFKPDISQPTTVWSGALEEYLRNAAVSGMETYVTVWHEPENDLGVPSMGSTANWRNALNKVTEICRDLTSEGVGTFYSTPILMDYTLNPSSGRDINDWLPSVGVDYDVIGFDIYPLAGSYIGAIDFVSDFEDQSIIESIERCEDFAISRNKPWAVPEIGTKRHNAAMTSAGVPSYTSTQRANWTTDIANHFSSLGKPPVFVTFFLYGDHNMNSNPELATLNAVVEA